MEFSGQTDGALLPRLFAEGYARVGLDAAAAGVLAGLHDEANGFFALSQEAKSRYSVANLTNGYRPPESAHATDPTMPDANDSFLYWSTQRAEKLQFSGEIESLLSAMEDYRKWVAAPVVGRLIDELVAYYGYGSELPFEQASLLQVNGFTKSSDRELLQTRHEDGTLATVIWGSGPGLEAFCGDTVIPLTLGRDEVVVMPGSILTTMTGNQIPPLYHRVRNYGNLQRKSIMYFCCPDVDKHIAPFVVNETNHDADIRELVLSSTDMFGLVDNFLIDS